MAKRKIGGLAFDFVGRIEPERLTSGAIAEFMPQNQYRNNRALPLNRYGGGPFCHFRISTSMHHDGVYAVVANQEVIYIGECQHLSKRIQ